MKKLNDFLKDEKYSFLSNNMHKVVLLCYGGSISYGTNVPESDVDLRGVTCDIRDLLRFSSKGQIENKETDTVLYEFRKFVDLACKCNPNILEQLFERPDLYLYISDTGKELLEHRDMFISKITIQSFGGYANSQFLKLKTILYGNDEMTDIEIKRLNKYAMHLVRLYDEGIQLLETGKMSVYREDRIPLYMKIRSGAFMNEDNSYKPEFIEDIVTPLYDRFKYASDNTCLQNAPNMDIIEDYILTTVKKFI